MGLRINRPSLGKSKRLIVTLMAVFALVIQPGYGFVAGRVAYALGQQNTVCDSVDVCDYTSIKDAIAGVASGSVINVKSGSYSEGLVTINKTVTLRGESRNNTLFNGQFLIKAPNVTIENFGISTADGKNGYSVAINSTDATVNKNTFRSNVSAVSAKAVFIESNSRNATITDNTINGVSSTGGGAYGVLAKSVQGLTISGNNIKNLNGLWATAIGLEGDTPGANVAGNVIKNLRSRNYPTSTAVKFENNPSAAKVALVGNSYEGRPLSSDPSVVVVDASINDIISTNGDTYQEVLSSDGTYRYYGINAFRAIQDGIDGAKSGGAVKVARGEYTEALSIRKSISVTGEERDSTRVKAPEQFANGGDLISVFGADVQVGLSNLSIDGLSNSYKSGGAGIHVHGGAYANIDNVSIDNVRRDPTGTSHLYAIHIGGTKDVGRADIRNSNISDYQRGGVYVIGSGSFARITNNYIKAADSSPSLQNGISVQYDANAVITDNTVIGNSYGGDNWSGSGISIWDGATDDTVVRGNTVTNNQVGLSLVTYTPSVLTNFDPQGSDGNNVNARVEANTLASWGDPSEVFYADIRGHKKGSIIFHQGAARVVGWNLLQDEEEPSIVSMSLDVIGDLDVTSAAINRDGLLRLTIKTSEELSTVDSRASLDGAGVNINGRFEQKGDEYVVSFDLNDDRLKGVKTDDLRIYFRLYDSAGNGTTRLYYAKDGGITTRGSEVYKFSVDNHAPDASIEGPSQGSVVGGDARVAVRSNASDLKSHWVEITDPTGKKWYSSNMSATGKPVYEFRLADVIEGGLVSGQYKLRYVATDKYGNRNDDVSSAIRTFTVDVTAPSVSYLGYDSVGHSLLFGSDEDVDFIVVDVDSGVYIGSPVLVGGSWVLSLPATLPGGDHLFTVSLRDRSGNYSFYGAVDSSLRTLGFTLPILPQGLEQNSNTSAGPLVVEDPDPSRFPEVLSAVSSPSVRAQIQQSESSDGEVLGSRNVSSAADSASILGAADVVGEDNVAGGKLLGLAWYWWVVILAVIGAAAWMVAAALRNRREDAELGF